MLPSLNCIKKEIDNLILILEPLLPLVNSHMVDYFINSRYKTSVPLPLQNDICNIGCDNAIDILLKGTPNPCAFHLNDYINRAKSCQLYNLSMVCLSQSDLHRKFFEWGGGDVESLKLKVFVTEKKSHEIELLTKVVATIYNISKTTHIIDVGCGKGYLSSLLALHHQIPVLGVDSSLLHTDGAIKRARLLEKAWKGFQHNPYKSLPSKTEDNLTKIDHLYKQVTQFVTEDTDFEQLISDIFLQRSTNFGLVGLHTCGDLAAACIKMYNRNNNLKTLCNVSCCYNLLNEEFESVNSKSTHSFGFPLSAHLRNKRFKLGHIALMLSAQPVDRILNRKELPSKILFYRSVLEVILEKYNICKSKRQVGKVKKKCENFVEYVHICLKNINVKLDLSNDELMKVYHEYETYENQLYVFYLLRCMLAPLIEAIILLDRLLFLHENGHANAFLTQLFDPIISPRCYALISLKR
ncbi:hypothetical protein PPYR_04967 [Photinus pyralis]|uniref:Methyltransferase domain-containing protein n=1 Tax=Photinus pyralis TaxID=7054 RepID=A0A1Y1NKE1_PHOPY|nr:methyltransferase-like protein 25 [Photinus pyralis]KAB0802781.1 hypothetical protein PPYR_04967 [Photinus pyralis]